MVRTVVPALLLLASGLLIAAEGDPAPAATAAAAPAAAPADDALLEAARLADIDFQRHLALVQADLGQADQARQILAIRNLGRLQDQSVVPRLIDLLEPSHHAPAVVMAASESLADLGATTAASALQRLLTHADPAVRATAQKSLTRLESMNGGLYQARSADPDDGLRASAVTNLGTLKRAEAAPVLISALRYDSRAHVRRMAAIGLGRLGDHGNAQPLMDALCDADPGVRRHAAEALVRIQAVEAIPNLLMALEANIAPTHLNRCLQLLSGQDFGFDPRANVLDRTAAIERGYEWWALNAKAVTAK